jgi:predicted translin family RNA/ssDNA-binding protein
VSTENRDNLIRILGNLIEDSKQTVEAYWNSSSNDFYKAIKSLKDTLNELDRTYVE